MANDRTAAADTAGYLVVGGSVGAGLGVVLAIVADSGLAVTVGVIIACLATMALVVGLVAYGVELGLRSSGVQSQLFRLLQLHESDGPHPKP